MSDDEIMAKALLIANKTIEEKNKKLELIQKENTELNSIIKEQKPTIEYTDKILNSNGTLLISQIAKDYGISAQELNNILHEEGIQYKCNGQWILYKEYQNKGYTDSETKLVNGYARVQTKWTQKGRMKIHEVLQKKNGRIMK